MEFYLIFSLICTLGAIKLDQMNTRLLFKHGLVLVFPWGTADTLGSILLGPLYFLLYLSVYRDTKKDAKRMTLYRKASNNGLR